MAGEGPGPSSRFDGSDAAAQSQNALQGPQRAVYNATESTTAWPATPNQRAWQGHWSRTLPELQMATERVGPPTDVPTMRSSQVDAGRLDEELALMLREQFMKAFAFLHPGVVSRLQPELSMLLDFLIFRFSVWEGRPLPGMALMNLRYRDERSVQSSAEAGGRSGAEGPGLSATQRSMYCLGAVFLRYGWARAGHVAASRHWGDAAYASWQRRGWGALRAAESAYRCAALLNLLAFFRTGRYRSVLERLVGARLVYAQPSAARAISYEYLNRQLVWSELSELLLFLLPLFDVAAVKRALRSALPRLPMLTGARLTTQQQQQGGRKEAGEDAALSGRGSGGQACGICGAATVLTPYAAQPCGHVFCYYCLRSHVLADCGFTCPRCLARVEGLRPGAARLAPLDL